MRPALALAGVAAALVGVAGLTVAGVADTDRDRVARQQIDSRAALVSEAAASQLNRYVDALTLTAGGLAAAQPLTAAAFTRITASLRDLKLSGVPFVAFVVPARDDQIASTQAQWRSRGSTGLILTPNRAVGDHLFTVLSQTVDGSDPPGTGFDSTRAPAAAAAMRQARESAASPSRTRTSYCATPRCRRTSVSSHSSSPPRSSAARTGRSRAGS